MKKLISMFLICFLCGTFFFQIEGEKNWWYSIVWEWQINKTVSIIGQNGFNDIYKNGFATQIYENRLNTIGIKIKF